MIKDMAKMTLAVCGDYYDVDDGRMLRIVGKNNKYSIRHFDTANLNKNYDAPKEFAAAYEEGRDEQQLTIEEARFINNRTNTRNSINLNRGYSQVEKETRMRSYGYLPGVWSPSPTPSSDDWYDDYERKQRPKSYY